MRPKFWGRLATQARCSLKSLARRRSFIRHFVIVIGLVLVAGSTVSGCSPFYVMRAAYEEGKILWRREPIVDVIDRPGIAADTQEKLKLVLSVRDFARDRLKLKVGGSFSSFSY